MVADKAIDIGLLGPSRIVVLRDFGEEHRVSPLNVQILNPTL